MSISFETCFAQIETKNRWISSLRAILIILVVEIQYRWQFLLHFIKLLESVIIIFSIQFISKDLCLSISAMVWSFSLSWNHILKAKKSEFCLINSNFFILTKLLILLILSSFISSMVKFVQKSHIFSWLKTNPNISEILHKWLYFLFNIFHIPDFSFELRHLSNVLTYLYNF